MTACQRSLSVAEELGIPYVTLTTSIEGESKDAGMLLATIAHEMQKTGRPFRPPMLIFSAGETTTTIPDGFKGSGHGGPSQELTAGFAVVARDVPGACMLSIDSEGSDGTTIMAGGLCDSTTWARATASGINLKEALRLHASFEALEPLHDCVFTGNTGTNLCDFNVLYVPAKG
jgi:glycerate-2-kinase